MPRIFLPVLVSVMLVASVNKANAKGGFYTGNTLFEYCHSENPVFRAICTGYILGIADALLSDKPYLGLTKVCYEGVTGKQLVDIIKKWLTEKLSRDLPLAKKCIGASM